jgi:hypothetical protein
VGIAISGCSDYLGKLIKSEWRAQAGAYKLTSALDPPNLTPDDIK